MRLKIPALAVALALFSCGCSGNVNFQGLGSGTVAPTSKAEEVIPLTEESTVRDTGAEAGQPVASLEEPATNVEEPVASTEEAVASPPATPQPATPQLVNVKPELDYSRESPDCITAAQRLADNVQVGMTLSEVTRLVGQPKLRVTGSWRWSKSFSRRGNPLVRFAFLPGRAHTVITGVVSDSSNCEPRES